MVNFRLFDGLDAAECDELIALLKLYPRRLADGDILLYEGMRTDNFWWLVSGRLKGERYYYDGSIDMVQLYTAGDIVCLDVVCTRPRTGLLQISCMGSAELVAIDYDKLTGDTIPERLRETLSTNVIRLIADESMRKQYKIDVLYKKSLRARISTFLQHMSEKTQSPRFDIGMNREQLAQYLGVNRSALSHELSLMQQDHLIKFSKSKFELFEGFANSGYDKR